VNKLAILAGGGDLPGRLIDACRASKRDFYVVALEGQAEAEVIGDAPHCWARPGAARKILDAFEREEVSEIVMAGRVTRPSLAALRPDALALRFMLKAGSSRLGDDGLLKAIIAQIEAEGYRVVGPGDILQGELEPVGSLGRHEPDEQAIHDIVRGTDILRALSDADVGQAVVVQEGIVLGVEAAEGTDALLNRCGELRRAGEGGVLFKLPKAGQEMRVDQPTIGPETVRRAREAGLRGIAVAAGATIIVDREKTLAEADELGIFIVALDADSWSKSH